VAGTILSQLLSHGVRRCEEKVTISAKIGCFFTIRIWVLVFLPAENEISERAAIDTAEIAESLQKILWLIA
jgi:hypothetical protein